MLVSVEWNFDVCFASHDDLKAGITEAGRHRVSVWTDTHTDAVFLATAMVAATTDCQPTLALLRL